MGGYRNIWLSDRSANQDHKSLAPQAALDLPRAALADCQKRGFQVAIAFVVPFGAIQVNCFGKSLDHRGRQWVRWPAQSEWRGGADADEACSKAGIEPFKATGFLELEQ